MIVLLDKILKFIADRLTRKIVLQTQFGVASAGSSNYMELTLPESVPNGATIIGVDFSTESLAVTRGLQLTPAYVDGNRLYIQWYAPNGLSIRTDWKITVSFFGGVS